MPRSLTDLLLLQGALVCVALAAGAFWYAWRHDTFSAVR